MTPIADLLNEIISDPILGPFEGEDYWIDADGTIQIAGNNAMLAGTVLRKTNNSGQFDAKLVKIGQRGDSIILGFDTLIGTESVYTANIGYMRDTLVEVKKDEAGKFCLYVNKKRATRMFAKLAAAKSFLKKLDHELKTQATEPESIDD
jgi:hypothetical protein